MGPNPCRAAPATSPQARDIRAENLDQNVKKANRREKNVPHFIKQAVHFTHKALVFLLKLGGERQGLLQLKA